MHTKSLVTLKQMLVERNVVRKERLNQSDLDPQTKSQLNLSSLDAVPANTRKSHADLQVRLLLPSSITYCWMSARIGQLR